jgi:hypothetical protein
MPHQVCGFLRRPRLSAHTTAFFDELNLAIIRRTISPLVAFDDPLSPTRAVGSNFNGERSDAIGPQPHPNFIDFFGQAAVR